MVEYIFSFVNDSNLDPFIIPNNNGKKDDNFLFYSSDGICVSIFLLSYHVLHNKAEEFPVSEELRGISGIAQRQKVLDNIIGLLNMCRRIPR